MYLSVSKEQVVKETGANTLQREYMMKKKYNYQIDAFSFNEFV